MSDGIPIVRDPNVPPGQAYVIPASYCEQLDELDKILDRANTGISGFRSRDEVPETGSAS